MKVNVHTGFTIEVSKDKYGHAPIYRYTALLTVCIRVTDFYAWQWQDEKGQWNPYSATVALDLEDARESNTATVSFEACHRSYSLDLSKMKQVNTITNVERDVERSKSGE